MKLTIIPADGAVYENGVCYSGLVWSGTPDDVHALQWYDDHGWLEFKDGKPNEGISALPEWALNAEAAWTEANTPKPPPEPVPPTADENKATALGLLSATDFTEIPSVTDPSSNPRLLNKADFIAYRDQVRIFAVYPVPGDIDWPVKPTERWSDPFENLP